MYIDNHITPLRLLQLPYNRRRQMASDPATTPAPLTPSDRPEVVVQWEALARHLDQETVSLGRSLRHRDTDRDGVEDPPFVALFASARDDVASPKLHEIYGPKARTLGQLLANRGFSMLTGGCPGIVEEAQRLFIQQRLDARVQLSVGIRINALELFDEPANPNLDIIVHAPVFGSRLELMHRFVEAAILLPGGFGSLLELAFFLQYSQVTAGRAMPICLLDRKFWGPLKALIHEMKQLGTINPERDLSFLHWVDSPEEAMEIIQAHNGIGARLARVREQLAAAS